MSNWQTNKLGDICEDISYGYTESAVWENIGPKFLRITDIQNDFINWNTVPCCPITKENHAKYKLEVGDIVIARTGATTGVTAIFKDEDIDAVYASYLIRYRVDKTKAEPFYIGHVLKSVLWKSHVNSIIGGSAQPGANAKQFAAFEFPLPDLSTQTQIASILSSLDDKIELNLQMNQTLEAMAQAIFKEWFVNFNYPKSEPLIADDLYDDHDLKRVKSGQSINHKNPGSDELVDGLPKGWRMGKLNEVISFVKGKKPDDVSIEQQEGYLPQILIDTFNTGNSVFANPNRMVIASQEEMLMVMDGASSGRVEIGYSGIVGSTIAKIILKNQFAFPLYIFFFLKSKEKDIMGNTTGSSIPHADKNKILDYAFVIPDYNTSLLFEQAASSLLEKIKINKSEIKTLTQIRDSLLPKLMTGKISLNH